MAVNAFYGYIDNKIYKVNVFPKRFLYSTEKSTLVYLVAKDIISVLYFD